MDRYFAGVVKADKAECVENLQREGCKVCFVGDGIDDTIAMKKADVSISLRGASSIAADTAHIVFLQEGLEKLCELRDIARDLDRNVKRSWSLILAPNIACLRGVFAMGFGIMASVVTSNVTALAALANGVLPLRKVAQLEAERRHRLEMSRTVATAARLHWHREGPRFTISADGLSSIPHFTPDHRVVNAESPPAAGTFATPDHRDQAVRFVESMAGDPGL